MDIKIKGTFKDKAHYDTHVDITVEVPDNAIGAWLAAVTRAGCHGWQMDPADILKWLKGEF